MYPRILVSVIINDQNVEIKKQRRDRRKTLLYRPSSWCLIMCWTGLYIMNVVVPRLGARKTVLIGSILVSLSTILASLTNDLTSLICVHSVLMGKDWYTLSITIKVVHTWKIFRLRPVNCALCSIVVRVLSTIENEMLSLVWCYWQVEKYNLILSVSYTTTCLSVVLLLIPL